MIGGMMSLIEINVSKQRERADRAVEKASQKQVKARGDLATEIRLMATDINYGDPVRLRPVIRYVLTVWVRDCIYRHRKKRSEWFTKLGGNDVG